MEKQNKIEELKTLKEINQRQTDREDALFLIIVAIIIFSFSFFIQLINLFGGG